MKQKLIPVRISALAQELSMLVHAGITVAEGLSLMAQESEGAHRKLLSEMAAQAERGENLSFAMRKTGVFPAYVCGLVEVGERAGRLEESLAALARYYESRARMDRRLKSALLYPAVMLVFMLVVIGILLVKILPIFNDVYASLGGRLTGVAGGLLVLGRWLGAAMPVLWAALFLLVACLLLFAGVSSFREQALGFWRKRHGDRGVFRKMNNARLAQALAMALASGLPVEEALGLAGSLMEDLPGAAGRCRDCRNRLENGASLSEALRSSGILSPGDSRMVELGQRSGSTDLAMERIAANLSQESEDALEDAVSRVEPALVLTCSVLVGAILFSVMLPLAHIMSAIG